MHIVTKNILSLLAALFLFGNSSISNSASVYKCIDNTGKKAYQSQPCPESARSSELDIRGASSMPILAGNTTVAEARMAIASNCVASSARQPNATLRKIAAERPRQFQDFCECVADNSLSDVKLVQELIARNDRAGIEQLGLKAGLSCAAKLR